MRLLIFGLGYTAERIATALATKGWHVTGTSRDGRDGTIRFADTAAVTREMALATHILSSVPPADEQDPVLAVFPDDIGNKTVLDQPAAQVADCLGRLTADLNFPLRTCCNDWGGNVRGRRLLSTCISALTTSRQRQYCDYQGQFAHNVSL